VAGVLRIPDALAPCLVLTITLAQGLQASAVENADPILQYLQPRRVYDVSLAAHAPLLATDGWDGEIDLWSTRSWTKKRSIAVGIDNPENDYGRMIALSPDGGTLARCAPRHPVELWNTSTGKLRKTIGEPGDWLVGIAWSPGSRFLATAGDVISLWDVCSGKVTRTYAGSYSSVAFSSDGKLIGGSTREQADVFDVATGRKMVSLKDKSGAYWPIAFSPDGKLVATGGEDPNWKFEPVGPLESEYQHELRVKIWDLRTGKLKRILPGHSTDGGGTKVLRFTSDSRFLFSGGRGYSALWDITTGKARRKWHDCLSADLSPDGVVVITGWKGLRLYSAKTGKELLQARPAR
jgi:WD40 repeat protein